MSAVLERSLKIARFAVGDILWKLANIAILAVAARVLPAEQAALVVLSQTASMILLSLGDLGFRSTGIRLLALEPSQTRTVMRAVLQRRLLSVVSIGLPGAAICSVIITDSAETFALLMLLVVAYLPYFLASEWSLLALGRTGFVAIARSVYAAILLLLAWLALMINADIYFFVMMIALAYTGMSMSSLAMMRWVLRASVVAEKPAILNIQRELSLSASLALAAAFALNTLFHSLEIILVGAFLGEADSSVFAAPFRLVFSVYAIGWVLAQYFSPKFARLMSSSEGYARYWMAYLSGFLTFGCVSAIATFLMAEWLVLLVYQGAFPEATSLLRTLSPSIALDAVVACLGTMLVMQNRGKAASISIGLGCMASAAVFFMLMDKGVMSAVYAKYAAYSGLALSQIVCLRAGRRISIKA